MLLYYLRAVKIKYYKLKISCTIDVALIRIFWKRAPGMQRMAAVPLSVKPKMKAYESCPKSYLNVPKEAYKTGELYCMNVMFLIFQISIEIIS